MNSPRLIASRCSLTVCGKWCRAASLKQCGQALRSGAANDVMMRTTRYQAGVAAACGKNARTRRCFNWCVAASAIRLKRGDAVANGAGRPSFGSSLLGSQDEARLLMSFAEIATNPQAFQSEPAKARDTKYRPACYACRCEGDGEWAPCTTRFTELNISARAGRPSPVVSYSAQETIRRRLMGLSRPNTSQPATNPISHGRFRSPRRAMIANLKAPAPPSAGVNANSATS